MVSGGPHTKEQLRRVLLRNRRRGGAGTRDVDVAAAAADPDGDGLVLSDELVGAVMSDSGWSGVRVRDVLRGCL
eukprot:scaffold27535_cov103-Phaeocystis_antarctica.AAC.7